MFAVAITLVAALLAPPTQVDGIGCADVHIVGVRGSGQVGYGEQVATYVDAVVDVVDSTGATWAIEALDYPALSLADSFGLALFTGDYDRSVAAGAEALASVLDRLRADCPTGQIVLIGYSQGSQVIKETLHARPIGDRVLSVFLLADPTRDIIQPGVVTFGSLDPLDGGALGPKPLPDRVRPIAIDICAPGDSVCTGTGFDFNAHVEGYAEADADAIAAFGADVGGSSLYWRRLIR